MKKSELREKETTLHQAKGAEVLRGKWQGESKRGINIHLPEGGRGIHSTNTVQRQGVTRKLHAVTWV